MSVGMSCPLSSHALQMTRLGLVMNLSRCLQRNMRSLQILHLISTILFSIYPNPNKCSASKQSINNQRPHLKGRWVYVGNNYFCNIAIMLSGPTSRAEQQIYQRRAQEQKVSLMQTKLKQEFHEQQFAKWQNKGKNIQINNQVKQRLASLRQASSINLAIRRQKLASLLADQDQRYKEQIVSMQETPEQTRERMAKRVKQLKEEKEKRRVQDVNERLEKRFEQGADELRKVDKDLKELKMSYERNMQLLQKQSVLQNQYEQEMLFAELNRRDQKKKEEAERLKQQQQREKVEERNAILAIQKELKKRKEDEEKQLMAQEKTMLKQEWERQNSTIKQKELQQAERQKGIHQTIHEENLRIKAEKEEAIRVQKERDRQMIERIVLKERQLAEYEKLMKEKEREEARRTLAGVKSKNQGLQAYEKELDRLIDLQRVKKEKKQQEEWEKREKARINLLYQVYDDRERKVNEHKAELEKQLKMKEEDRIEVERRVREYEREQERRKQQEFERNQIEQRKLLEEIAAKEEKRRLLLQQLQREEEEEERNRQQYTQKIEERKQQGREQLQQFKRTNRIF